MVHATAVAAITQVVMAAATTVDMEVVITAANAAVIPAVMVVPTTAVDTEGDIPAAMVAGIPADTAVGIRVAAIPVVTAVDTPAAMVVDTAGVITGADSFRPQRIWLNEKPHRKLSSGGVCGMGIVFRSGLGLMAGHTWQVNFELS